MIIKFFEKQFSDENSKDAYLKACKWVVKYIISKVEIGETFWNITKVNDADLPTFNLALYAALNPDEVNSSFCDRCKEFHKSFYINQQYNCNTCNYTAFKKQMEQKLNIKKNYRKKRLRYILDKYK